jgi:TPR repeat protein
VELATLVRDGRGGAQDLAQAVELYPPAAPAVKAEAANQLGHANHHDNAVEAAPAAALTWLRRAADLEHGDAMLELGTAYLNGEGVAKDPAEAARWFDRAAQLGSAEAMNELGVLCLSCRVSKMTEHEIMLAIRQFNTIEMVAVIEKVHSFLRHSNHNCNTTDHCQFTR